MAVTGYVFAIFLDIEIDDAARSHATSLVGFTDTLQEAIDLADDQMKMRGIEKPLTYERKANIFYATEGIGQTGSVFGKSVKYEVHSMTIAEALNRVHLEILDPS